MFLTLEDPRARVQGSRDPLGVQPVWAAFGRCVVANLTTVTTSIRGFTIHILGRLFGEKLIEKGAAGEQDALSIFLRMEQAGAYARYVGHKVDDDIRGIERVKRFAEDGGGKVTIQDDATGMILSDQKTYGLWGLYSVAARVSGISADGPVGLSERAREFANKNYWPLVVPVESKLMKLMGNGGTLRIAKTDPVFSVLAKLLPERLSVREREFYAETLRDALYVKDNPAAKRQAFFAELLKKHSLPNEPTGRSEILGLAKAARKKEEALAVRLEKIARLEAFFAPAEALFDHLQNRKNQKPSDLAVSLAKYWGRKVPHLDSPSFDDLAAEIREVVGDEMAAEMKRCDAALGNGDYEDAIVSLLEWNKMIMAARNAAPWIRLVAGKLDVRFRSQEKTFPGAAELPELWRNSYFIDALKSIVLKLEEEG